MPSCSLVFVPLKLSPEGHRVRMSLKLPGACECACVYAESCVVKWLTVQFRVREAVLLTSFD